MKNNGMHVAVLATFGFCASVASAATTHVVDSVDELIAAVASSGAGDTIRLLSAGSPYEFRATDVTNGVGHLYIDKAVNFIGETGNPKDVVLVGNGQRILYIDTDKDLTISGITFKNGDATHYTYDAESKPGESQEGGAICFRKNDTSALVTNCVFNGNAATAYGGAVGSLKSPSYRYAVGVFVDCLFTNNTSASSGGAIRSPRSLVNCTFVDNKAIGNYAGAAYQTRLVNHCTFVNNAAGASGGALSWATVDDSGVFVVSNSVFRLNHAQSGGAIYETNRGAGSKLIGCTFEGNFATGTGASNSGGALLYATNGVYNCNFITNYANYGANVAYSSVSGCTFCVAGSFGAATMNGEVAYYGSLCDCTCILNGSASSGALVSYSGVVGTSFSGTLAGSTSGYFLYDSFDRCRFEVVSPTASSAAGYLFGRTTSLTNCLIAGCEAYSYFYNTELGAGFYNCTFVSNVISRWKAGGSTQRVAPVVNCLFYGNTVNGEMYDIISDTASCISAFSNSIFSASAENEQYAVGSDNQNIYGMSFNPRFVGVAADPVDPYVPRRSSPIAKKRGLVEEWMRQKDDLRGDGFPMVRENNVNPGCYQALTDGPGLMFIFR